MSRPFVIGTRGSALALWQAHAVEDALHQAGFPHETEIRIISTKGDRILDKPLEQIGDKGLFTKELEAALISGEVDACVHSMKDVSAELPAGCIIGAMLPRADVRDVQVVRGEAIALPLLWCDSGSPATITANGLPKGLAFGVDGDGQWVVRGVAKQDGVYYVTFNAKKEFTNGTIANDGQFQFKLTQVDDVDATAQAESPTKIILESSRTANVDASTGIATFNSISLEKNKDKDVLGNMDKVINLAKATQDFRIKHIAKKP